MFLWNARLRTAAACQGTLFYGRGNKGLRLRMFTDVSARTDQGLFLERFSCGVLPAKFVFVFIMMVISFISIIFIMMDINDGLLHVDWDRNNCELSLSVESLKVKSWRIKLFLYSWETKWNARCHGIYFSQLNHFIYLFLKISLIYFSFFFLLFYYFIFSFLWNSPD